MNNRVIIFLFIVSLISCKKKYLEDYYGDYRFEFHGSSTSNANGPTSWDTTYFGSISKYETFHGNKYHKNRKIQIHYRGDGPAAIKGWDDLTYSPPLTGTFFPEVDEGGNINYPEFTGSSSGYSPLYSLWGKVDHDTIEIHWGAAYDFDMVFYNLVGYKL